MSLFLLLLTLILSDPYEILAKTELQKNWGQKNLSWICSEFSLHPLSFMFFHFFVKLFFPASPKWRTFERVMKTSQPCRKIFKKSPLFSEAPPVFFPRIYRTETLGNTRPTQTWWILRKVLFMKILLFYHTKMLSELMRLENVLI